MMFSLNGKIALVTGATQGLGLGMAVGLAQQGADIVAMGIGDMMDTQKEVERYGRRFTAIEADFSNTSCLVAAAQKAIKAYGRVDILLNNAGVTPKGLAENYTEENYDLAMTINVKALFMLTQQIAKHMINNKYGKIINIASIQAIIGGNNVAAYVASKHAVAGLTKTFANEWGKYGLNVNAIAPGFMLTQNTHGLRELKDAIKAIDARIPLGRWGIPEDLKGPICFLASDASNYVNGHLLVVDGGYLNN